MARGIKTGGRKPGSKNRHTKMIEEISLKSAITKGVEFAEAILDGKVPCGVCHGIGKTQFQPKSADGEAGIRPCQSCWGSCLERLSPSERLRAALELMEYGFAKRRAVEVHGPEGGPIEHEITVNFVRPEETPDAG